MGIISRTMELILGYAYPAYECYKAVEMNKPEIEQLRFWCKYWILVALIAVVEWITDIFLSWLPLYREAKLVFYIYMWYPKTRGAGYVYDTFFKPYLSKHEKAIDRNLLELKTRTGDMAMSNFQKCAKYGQHTFFEMLSYVATQSQSSRFRPQRQTSQPDGIELSAAPVHRTTVASRSTSTKQAEKPKKGDSDAKAEEAADYADSENVEPEDTVMGDTIQAARNRLRKRGSMSAGGAADTK